MDNYTELEKLTYDTLDGCMGEDFCEDDLFVEKNDIMRDLPLEMQFNYNDFVESYHNVYNYYLDKTVGELPDIFYNDYIFTVCDNAFKMQNHKDLISEIKEVFINKNINY